MTHTQTPVHQPSPPLSPASDNAPPARPAPPNRGRRLLAVVRIALGWTFLWAFLDKLFGLGYDTAPGAAWIDGVSPTAGYLTSRDGSLGNQFQALAGNQWADIAFMGGMCALGISLILGIGLRLAAIGGSILMLSMWMSMLPLSNNPFMDQHVIYALVLVALALTRAGDTWGLGKPWAATRLVTAVPLLR